MIKRSSPHQRTRPLPDNSIARGKAEHETGDVTSATKRIYSAQVRELVEFALRTGDLGGDRMFVGPGRALAGTRGHQKLQKSRPAGYQKEMAVSYQVEIAELILRIQGRIDGVSMTSEEVTLEEINTVQGAWDDKADPLHWAQPRCDGGVGGPAHA